MRLDEGLARASLGTLLGGGDGAAERARGVQLLKDIGAARELRTLEEAG